MILLDGAPVAQAASEKDPLTFTPGPGHHSAVAHQVECFAYIGIGRGQNELAARLLGAAEEARARLIKA